MQQGKFSVRAHVRLAGAKTKHASDAFAGYSGRLWNDAQLLGDLFFYDFFSWQVLFVGPGTTNIWGGGIPLTVKCVLHTISSFVRLTGSVGNDRLPSRCIQAPVTPAATCLR